MILTFLPTGLACLLDLDHPLQWLIIISTTHWTVCVFIYVCKHAMQMVAMNLKGSVLFVSDQQLATLSETNYVEYIRLLPNGSLCLSFLHWSC